MNLSSANIGKHASDDIASASYNGVPTERQQFCGGSECYTAMNCIVLVKNWVLRGQSLQSVLVYNFTTMHAMSYRSDFLNCSCRDTIQEPAVRCTVSLLSAVCQVELPSFLILSAMSHSKSLNISVGKVMISSKHEGIFIRDVNDLTLEIIFNTWWASINRSLKRPIAWNNSRYAPSWQFYLHWGIDDSGSPAIICIVCHQVLRHPPEHGTSLMG